MTQQLPAAAPRRLKEMRPAQIAAILAADPRMIIPVGTCEQHGPHMPLGCDTLIVERLADDLSAEFGVLRAPSLEYGVNVATERGYAGNASLRRKTLHRQLNDLVDSWESMGVREFILLTAHEHDPHLEALSTVNATRARVRAVDVFAIDFSDLLEGQREPMHGDEVDTSLMLYIAPHLVDMTRAEDYMMSREELRRYRRGWLRVPRNSPGSIGRPRLASAEKGEMLYRRIYELVRDRILNAQASDEEGLQATGRPGRLHSVLQTRQGESAKEYVVASGAVILDEDVFHQYTFVPLARRSGEVTVVVPRRNSQVTGRLEERGQD